MSDREAPAGELVNKGFVVLRPDVGGSAAGRSFIVTGLQRSGTSLVAGMLRQVGIFMGAEINDIVHEDEAIARVIDGRDHAALRRLIAARNAAYGTWGFKLPMLCDYLDAADIRWFQAPHVIVTFRDPLAVAVRASLSDFQDALPALQQVAAQQAALVRFVTQLACPTLLVSYEKALLMPADFVAALVRFCGLPDSAALRAQLARLIEPNRASYIAGARRRFDGRIEGMVDGHLYGWCRLTASSEPVALEVLADGQVVRRLLADGFRQDLLDAGFGSGRHGFRVELAPLGLPSDAVLRVRVAEHGVELDNGGRRLLDYGARRMAR
jgi:hypothetical protein